MRVPILFALVLGSCGGTLAPGESNSADVAQGIGIDVGGRLDRAVLDCWKAHGGLASVGRPVSNGGGPAALHPYASGMAQDFDGGTYGPVIIMHQGGQKPAVLVRGGIRWKYLSSNAVGSLGYPLGEEFNITGGAIEIFEHGYVLWTQSTGDIVAELGAPNLDQVALDADGVTDTAIDDEWRRLGDPLAGGYPGAAGGPIGVNGGPVTVHRFGAGLVQDFAGEDGYALFGHGVATILHRDGADRAFEVTGAVRDYYLRSFYDAQGNWVPSRFGYPISQLLPKVDDNPYGTREVQGFEHGTIEIDSEDGWIVPHLY